MIFSLTPITSNLLDILKSGNVPKDYYVSEVKNENKGCLFIVNGGSSRIKEQLQLNLRNWTIML
jgi:hypothetical protein